VLPVILQLEDRPCLVVGGGGVALRKVRSLLEEQAAVIVVAPRTEPELAGLAERGTVRLVDRAYQAGDVAGAVLVFAATDSSEVNRQVAADAAAAGVLCNVADDPGLCTFQVPARVRRGRLQLTVASDGGAPFAVRRLRRLLERLLGGGWDRWIEAAADYREQVRRRLDAPEARDAAHDRFFDETVQPARRNEEGDPALPAMPAMLRARVPALSEREAWIEAIAEARPAEARPAEAPGASTGQVALVGSGPGCPGLLTLRGYRRLLAADAVVFDRLAEPALPADLPAAIELHNVGKRAGHHRVPQEGINELLVRLARQGKRVVRLKGGDPFVFGRGGEEAEVLAEAGIPFEVVPGVTSGVAAPAWIGVPVTHRKEAVRVSFLTAHESTGPGEEQARWDLLAQDSAATLVGYMGVSALPGVVERLIGHGMDPSTPAAMIERGTTAAQRHVVSTLGELVEAVAGAGIQPPALFVIGPTVRHARDLGWWSCRPLAGQRLAMAAQGAPGLEHASGRLAALADALELAGAEVVMVPAPLTEAARLAVATLPLTGCVATCRLDVLALDRLVRSELFPSQATAWCLGERSARVAAEAGWARVVDPLRGAADGWHEPTGRLVQALVEAVAKIEAGPSAGAAPA